MALASNALTLVAMVEQALGLTPGTETPALERLINAKSEAIERWCNRRFAKATETEKLVGHGGYRIHLSRTPVVSVTSVTYQGTTLDASSYELEDAATGALWRDSGWLWTAAVMDAANPYFQPGTEKASYSIVYVGGYVTPHQQVTTSGAVRNLPYDLEQACIEACVSSWARRGADRSVRSESLLSASVTYDSDPRQMPVEVLDALKPYRRVVLG